MDKENIYSYEDFDSDFEESFDVVVVGSGAGGGSIAFELANAGLSVAILEEGRYYTTSDFSRYPLSELQRRLYRDGGGEVILGNPNIYFAEGRCVGGSTVINGGMCWRLPEHIMKKWNVEFGIDYMTPKDMEPIFKRVEKIINVEEVKDKYIGKDSFKLKEGAEKLGYRVQRNKRNQKGCVGSNMCVTGCPTGGKQSVLVTYIPMAIKKGAVLFSTAWVKRILFKGRKAVGVYGYFRDPDFKYGKDGKKPKKFKIYAKIIIISGGAIQTPSLLLRSGVKGEHKNVGKYFYTHPNVKVVGFCKETLDAYKGVNQGFQVIEFQQEGYIMGTNFVPPGLYAMSIHDFGNRNLELTEEFIHNGISAGVLIEDMTYGRVFNDPFGNPIAVYNITDYDMYRIKRGIFLLGEILFAAGCYKLHLPIFGMPEVKGVDELKRIFDTKIDRKDIELITVHIMGTARMSKNSKKGPVSPNGNIHGIDNLFVADASLFPAPIGVNPQETIMALSTKIAEYIIDNYNSIVAA